MKPKKSGWSPNWTKAKSPVTQQLVDKIGGVLSRLIEDSSENLWAGKIGDLLIECGETDEDEYGTYLHALPIVKNKYNIKAKSAGRNGNKYYFCDELLTSKQHKLNSTQINDQIPPIPTIHITVSFEYPDQTYQATYSFTINPLDKQKSSNAS